MRALNRPARPTRSPASTTRPAPTTLGTGHPRLNPINAGHLYVGEHAPSSVRLRGEVTTIGSSESADVVVPGLAPWHAEVRRSAADEYAIRPLEGPVTVNGAVVRRSELHSGDRVTCGPWSFSFSRDASTDHVHVKKDDLVEPSGVLGRLEHLVFLLYGTATRVAPKDRTRARRRRAD